MCGRFSLGTTNLKAEYGLEKEVSILPRYNIAPGSEVLVIVNENGKNVPKIMRWGFQFSDKEGVIQTVINSKGETIHEKNMFKKSFEYKRCLVPATGFYEWKQTAVGKVPYNIFLKEQKMFSLGAIYRTEKYEGMEIECCVIITTPPNELMSHIHSRMPLIIDKLDEHVWLTGTLTQALNLVKPFENSPMSAFTVSKKVNNAQNEGEELVEEFSWELGK